MRREYGDLMNGLFRKNETADGSESLPFCDCLPWASTALAIILLVGHQGQAVATSSKAYELRLGGNLKFGFRAADGITRDNEKHPSELYGSSEINGLAEFATPFCRPKARLGLCPKVGVRAEVEIIDSASELGAIDEASVFFENTFGKIEIGENDGSEDTFALGAEDIASGTGGIDGDTFASSRTAINDSSDAAKISYETPMIMSQFQFGVSVTTDDDALDGLEDHVGVGLKYVPKNSKNVALSAVGSFGNGTEGSEEDLEAFAFGATVNKKEKNDFRIGFSYGNNNRVNDFEFFTIGVTYNLAEIVGRLGIPDANVGVSYNSVDFDRNDDDFASYALSGDIFLYKIKNRYGCERCKISLLADIVYTEFEEIGGDTSGVIAINIRF